MSDLPSQQEFITYLASLAEDDETFLFVRQKPIGGKTCGDGTPMYTWPAYLPKDARKIKDDWAVYGNTGAFLKDRMTDRVSASSANCDYVLCMVLDDIGSKSKEPPLPPTWIMETSEKNYQWGYVFSEQPGRGAFAAAIRAIAEAGFTDPGACNPVRNFRLPGSVNLKTDKDGFRSRLVEFHKEREFELEEICEALGVTPGEDEGDGFRSLKINRQDDEVLNWLSDKGFVLSPVNSDGWCQIVCPNHAEHSDPNDVMAKYNTNDRGFICYHGHCQDWDSHRFVKWVADNDGPIVKHGPDIDGEVDELGEALRTQYPGEMTPEVATTLKKISSAQRGRVEASTLHSSYAYLASDDAYFNMDTRKVYKRQVFNATFRHIQLISTISGRKVDAATWYDENRVDNKGFFLEGITYAPGEGRTVVRNDGVYGNTWADARPEVDKTLDKDVSIWLDHCRTLVRNEQELDHVLDVMAFKLQNPAAKINHAVLLAGRQGCGKDTMFEPLIWGVCGPYYLNRGYLDSKSLNTPWGDHLESEILVINELKESSAAERKALANDLKPIIAAPPEYLPINKKHQSLYKAVNRTFVLAYSNERNPISLSSDDRRWFVIWTEAKRRDDQYFKRIWDWYGNGGLKACVAWLYRRDVSAFNPAATPPMTSFKDAVINGGRSMSEAWLIEQMQDEVGEFANGVVGGSFAQLADRLQGTAPDRVTIHHAAVTDALQEAGWEYLGKLHSRAHNSPKAAWVSPRIMEALDQRTMTKSEVRDMLEATTSIHILKHA